MNGVESFAPGGEIPVGALPAEYAVVPPVLIPPTVEYPTEEDRVFTLHGKPFDDARMRKVEVHLSDRGPYRSAESDTPSEWVFPKRLLKAFDLSVSVMSGGRLRDRQETSNGAVTIANSLTPNDDRTGEVGDLDDYAAYRWKGAKLDVYAGRMDEPWSEHVLARTLEGNTFSERGGLMTVTAKNRDDLYEAPLQTNVYRGMGGAVHFNSDSDTCLAATTTFLDNLAAPFTLQAWFQRTSNPGHATQHIVGKQGILRVHINNSDDTLRCRYYTTGAASDAVYLLLDADVSNNHDPIFIVWEQVDETEAKIWLNGILQTNVQKNFVADARANGNKFAVGSNHSGASNFRGYVSEVAIFDTVRPSYRVKGAHLAPTRLAHFGSGGWPEYNTGSPYYESASDALAIWPFNEGTGTTVANEVTANDDLTLVSVAWHSTYEGPEGIAGTPKPQGFGHVQKAEPVWIDTVNHVCQINDGSIDSITTVEEDGLPDTTTKPGGGGLIYDGDVGNVYDATAPIAGHFKSDNSRGVLRFGSQPSGKIRVTFRGDDAGSGGYVDTISGVMQRIIEIVRPEHLVSEYHFDLFEQLQGGEVQLYNSSQSAAEDRRHRVRAKTTGKLIEAPGMTVGEAFDWLARTGGASWGKTVTGYLTIWRLEAPDGSGAEEITDRDIHGEIEILPSAAPDRYIMFGYEHHWSPLDLNDIAGAVDDERREGLTRQYRYVHYEVVEGASESLKPDRVVDSLFVKWRDAYDEAERQGVLYGTVRRWLRFKLRKDRLDLEIGQQRRLKSTRYGMDLGSDFVTTGYKMTQRPGNRISEIEIWGGRPARIPEPAASLVQWDAMTISHWHVDDVALGDPDVWLETHREWPSALTQSGGLVSDWDGLDAGDNDATQATAARKPTYVSGTDPINPFVLYPEHALTGVEESPPAVWFDAGGNRIEMGLDSTFSAAGAFTLIVAFRPDFTVAPAYLFDSGNGDSLGFSASGVGGAVRLEIASSVAFVTAAGAFLNRTASVFVLTRDGSNNLKAWNGLTDKTNGSPTLSGTFSMSHLGRQVSDENDAMIAAVFGWQGEISSADRIDVVQYLNARYVT